MVSLPLELDKVLYIDVDIIVKSSVFNLYRRTLMILMLLLLPIHLIFSVRMKKLGLKGKDNYFNAGIMLINLDKWRRDIIEENFLMTLL